MKLIRSFGYALHGMRYAYKTQLNFRIHLVFLVLVCVAGFAFAISSTEWLLVIICSTAVLAFELMNTAIEHLCDAILKDFHPGIKIIKDVSAAAVLLTAIGSIVIGGIIFLPKIIFLIKTLQ
jgi:diacylglycerol kinase